MLYTHSNVNVSETRVFARNFFKHGFTCKTYDLHENAKILPSCTCKTTRYSLNHAYQRKKLYL